jgi:hypothetical protein
MPRTATASTSAKNHPVLTTKIIESAEQPLGHTVRKPKAGTKAGEPQLVAVAERMPDPEKLAMLAFMDELVTIRPATSTDKNAEQIFELTINGKTELFKRGEPKTVKRKYVDLMARLKVTAYTQRDAVGADGERQILNDPHTALKYDFAMLKDSNPLGESWLKATLAMPG